MPPALANVVERIGLGAAQLRAGLLGGCVWLADGSELLLIGTVTRAVSEEWGMDAWQRGSVVSVVFVGILLGNSLCGPLGDSLGRRLPILMSYLGIAVFSVLSACAQNFYQLAAIRVLVGASFGVGQPAFNTLCTEITPTYWRILMNSMTQGLFILGELYSALLVWMDDPHMKHLHWRWLLLMGAIPSAVCGVLAYFFLHQSPFYLASVGEFDEAERVLKSMATDNRAPHLDCDFRRLPPRKSSSEIGAAWESISIIYSWRLMFSTLVVIYSCFTLNVVFYGCLYAFPQVVSDVDMGHSAAVSLVIGALWELPGAVLAAFCGMFWPRKPVMAGYLTVTALSLLAFGIGAGAQMSGHGDLLLYQLSLHGGYIGIKTFAVVGFVAVYQYSTEIYPTVARTTGTAACVAGGRLGGMVAPLVFERLLVASGRYEVFFYFVASLCLINLVLVVFLPLETFGKALQDEECANIDETTPLVFKD